MIQTTDLTATIFDGVMSILTLGALVVAFYNGRRSTKDLREERKFRQDTKNQEQAERRQALSISLDWELFNLQRSLVDNHEAIAEGVVKFRHNPEGLEEILAWTPDNTLPLLTRFAGDLGCFGPLASARLLSVLSGYQTLCEKHNERVRDLYLRKDDWDEVIETLKSQANSLPALWFQAADARGHTHPIALTVDPEVPGVDDFAEQVTFHREL